jgi:hypothetical protein
VTCPVTSFNVRIISSFFQNVNFKGGFLMFIVDQKVYNAARAYEEGDEIEVTDLLEASFSEQGAEEIIKMLSWDMDTDCPSDDFLMIINDFLGEYVYKLSSDEYDFENEI